MRHTTRSRMSKDSMLRIFWSEAVLANRLQYHSHPVYDPRLRRRLSPILLLLLARNLLPGHIRLLRSLRHRLFLRTTLPLHRPRSP